MNLFQEEKRPRKPKEAKRQGQERTYSSLFLFREHPCVLDIQPLVPSRAGGLNLACTEGSPWGSTTRGRERRKAPAEIMSPRTKKELESPVPETLSFLESGLSKDKGKPWSLDNKTSEYSIGRKTKQYIGFSALMITWGKKTKRASPQ